MKNLQTMRDVLIQEICKEMDTNKKIMFLSDDFGAPALDVLRQKYKDRFINVGIAEQNLINIACGLSLEGFVVYVYGISSFITMRNYEQIRVNLSQLSQLLRDININIIGVGAGMSYDISGPSHHCFEDLTIMRLLPNFILFSPSDCYLVKNFLNYSLNIKKPKYIRLDSQPLPNIYDNKKRISIKNGFYELKQGEEICIVSTGYMTHTAINVAKKLSNDKIKVGVIDVFLLKPINYDLMFSFLQKYQCIITLEEGFISTGGLDSLISDILNNKQSNIKLINIGIKDTYNFAIGDRLYLHKLYQLDEESIMKIIRKVVNKV